MSKEGNNPAAATQPVNEDEPDEWCVQLTRNRDKRFADQGAGIRESSAPGVQVRLDAHQLAAQLIDSIDRRECKVDGLLLRKERLACVQERGE